jgi:hypothetical protein
VNEHSIPSQILTAVKRWSFDSSSWGGESFDVSENSLVIVQDRDVCGVYFLIQDEAVVYVGQSVNVYARMKQHALDKVFDRCLFLPIPQQYIGFVEQFFIGQLKPVLNCSGVLPSWSNK